MIVCYNRVSDEGCGAHNPDTATQCHACQRKLDAALRLHDIGSIVRSYRIESVIGYGGFGAVYKAEDLENHRDVALKQTLEAEFIRSFKREFDILNTLHHDHLPRYYDMFEEQGYGYLVMEFVPGQSLQDILDRKTDSLLPKATVLSYAIQICDVLSYLHDQNDPIIHRDIKPANIRLTQDGVIKLVDFGLVKQIGRTSSQHSKLFGTLAYSPPEQFVGRTTPSSDIYALGATLYHLLSGTEPLPSVERTVEDTLLPLSQISTSLSPHVSDAVAKAMSLKPQDRFPNASAFKDALITVQRPTKISRHPFLWGGIVVLLLALVATLWSLPAIQAALGTTPTTTPSTEVGGGTETDTTETGAVPSLVGRIIFWTTDEQGNMVLNTLQAGTIAQTSLNVPGLLPALSPDGTQVAFAWRSSEGQVQIQRIPANGGAPQVLADLEAEMDRDETKSLVWSSNNTLIAVIVHPAGSSENVLGIVNVAGGGYTPITGAEQGSVQHAVWSPTVPDTIMFDTEKGGQYTLFQASVGILPDGAIQASVLPTGISGFLAPAWSPDGTRIAAVKPDGTMATMNPDGSDVVSSTALLDTNIHVLVPMFSPNGTFLAFLSDQYEIWVAGSDKTELTRLTEPICQSFAWSPDSSYLAFVLNNKEGNSIPFRVQVVNIETGDTQEIAQTPYRSLYWK